MKDYPNIKIKKVEIYFLNTRKYIPNIKIKKVEIYFLNTRKYIPTFFIIYFFNERLSYGTILYTT